MKCENFGEAWLDVEVPFPCEIHAFKPRESSSPNNKKVLAIYTEPKALMVSSDWVRSHYKEFDLIVSYDKSLADLPNVRHIYYGGCWCDIQPQKKEFGVSFILSTGCSRPELEGYDIRKQIPIALSASKAPARLFLSSRRINVTSEEASRINDIILSGRIQTERMGENKASIFESMFHIAVENSKNDYYFTEKLIDCFRTFTVPIYYGSPTVFEVFERDGIILVESAEEAMRCLENLTPADYWSRISAMHKNYHIAAQYLDPMQNLQKLIIDYFLE